MATCRPPRGNPDSDDGTDDIEQPETAKERNARYQRSSPSETSDPDHWVMLHHGDDEMSYDSDRDSRDGTTRNTRIPENDLGPTARREQILYYMSLVGKMFGTTIERSHSEYDIPRRFPGEECESLGSFVESLFQL